MPQNTKDSNGGKNQPAKDTGNNSGKRTDKKAADNKSGSVPSTNKGEKKTTP